MLILIEDKKEASCVRSNRDIYEQKTKSNPAAYDEEEFDFVDIIVNVPKRKVRYADKWEKVYDTTLNPKKISNLMLLSPLL
jgi:hypothetical protein